MQEIVRLIRTPTAITIQELADPEDVEIAPFEDLIGDFALMITVVPSTDGRLLISYQFRKYLK